MKKYMYWYNHEKNRLECCVGKMEDNQYRNDYVEKYSERNISSEKELADFLQAFLASDAQIYLVDLQRQVKEKDVQIERLRKILCNRQKRIEDLKSESELNASRFASTTYVDPDYGHD